MGLILRLGLGLIGYPYDGGGGPSTVLLDSNGDPLLDSNGEQITSSGT